MTNLWDMADKLGELSHAGKPQPIERAQPITKPVAQFRRKDLWPADVWAEMQRIQGESLGEVVDGLLGAEDLGVPASPSRCQPSASASLRESSQSGIANAGDGA